MTTLVRLALFGVLASPGASAAEKPKYPDVPMTRPEQMLAEHKTTFFHSSTFVELEGGRILHAANTSFTTSDDGGLTWSQPSKRVDTQGNPVGGGNTSLVKLSGMGVGLAAGKRVTGPGSDDPYHMVFWRSEDGGQTWQPPVGITPPGLPGVSYQDVLLRTSSGRILLPVYTCHITQPRGPNNERPPFHGKLVNNQWVSTSAHFSDPAFCTVYVAYSDDDGRTWKKNRDGYLYILHDWSTGFDRVDEPSVAEVAPGRLLMVMRASLGRLYQSWSDDNGETWTRPQPTSLAATETPAQIRRLPTGHLLIVWNQESEEEVQRGYNRTRISSAISRNGGSVWEFFQNVESLLPGARVEPGPIRPVRPEQYYFSPGKPAPDWDGKHLGDSADHGRWSYPSVFVMKDRVLVAYTYSVYEQDPVKAQLVLSSGKPGGFNQKLKVLPLKWFYGGKEPGPNPFLKEAYEPAKP